MIRALHSNELFTVLIMLGLIIVALAKLVAPKRFEEFLLILGNSKYLKIHHREPKFLDVFDTLLFANFSIGLSVFVFMAYKQLYNYTDSDVFTQLKLIGSVSGFFLIKAIIERIIATVFEINKLIDHYIFQKTTYKNFVGLLLIPVNGILIFNFNNSSILILIFIALFLLISIIGFITTYKTYQSLILPNLFYFILYLCALEIAPFIVLYKAFVL